MKAIFIAAGQGSRLGSFTKDLPKPLVPVNGKSILERQIELLHKNNISEIIIVTGYKKEKFKLQNVDYLYNPNFHEYNGIAWATGGSCLSGLGFVLHSKSGPCGTQTAGLMVGGYWGQSNGSGGAANWGNANRTEEYNGTSSAYGGTLTHPRVGHWQVGSQTNAYACFGSNTTAGSRITEKYDGNTWSITTFAITAPAGATGLGQEQPGCGSTSTGFGMSIDREHPLVAAVAQTDNFSP